MSLRNLQASVVARFCTGLNDFIENPCRLLCDGPQASKPLDEEGFHRIIKSISNITTSGNDKVVDETAVNTIHLWFREFNANNSPLCEETSTDKQDHTEYILSPNTEEKSKEINKSSSRTSEPNESDSESAGISVKSVHSSSEIPDSSNESLDKGGHTWIRNVREQQKVQYKTDIFTSNKKRNKKNQIRKKYVLHLQGVKDTKQKRRPVHPVVRMPLYYFNLMKKKKTVISYIAVVKRANGRLYLHPLKGFLVDKKNPKVPLENPYMMRLEWEKRNIASPRNYTLKLALFQVAGDVNRRCKTEFNQQFDFTHREVDEVSKSLGDNEDDILDDEDDTRDDEDDTRDDEDDDNDEYQLAIVLAEDDKSFKADWSTLIISHTMRKAIYKRNGKTKKTRSSTDAT